MKSIPYSKSLLSAGLICALTACGGDDNNNANNNAPVLSGDLTVTVTEDGEPVLIDLLDGAVDTDPGDILRVRNLNTDEEDKSGLAENHYEIGLLPSAYKADIDSGETKTIVYTFDVSDGHIDVARTLTINIEGYDVEPEFNDLTVSRSEDAGDSVQIDLLQGATDGDGETLTVASAQAVENPYSAGSISGNTLTIDISAFAEEIKGGDTVTFVYQYDVEDHNHSLPRTATVNITGVSTEPEPPTVYEPQTAVFSTTDARFELDLTAAPAIIDWNGGTLSVDYDSLAPVDGAPAMAFEGSQDGMLLVDPLAFYPVSSATPTTYSYTYMVVDPTGLEAEATLELTVTRASQTNRLSNGGFENGLTGWSETNGGVVSAAGSSALGLDFSGSALLSFSDLETLTVNLPQLDTASDYFIEARVRHMGPWDGGNMGTVLGEVDGMPGEQVTAVNMYEHGAGNRTQTVAFTATDAMSYAITANQVSELDDIRLYRYAFDQGINLLSEDDSTFENGAGNWMLGAGATVSDTNAIDGSMSLHSGTNNDVRNILPLGVGAIENGKRYLFTMDVEIDNYAAANHAVRVSVVDAASNDTTALGGPFTGVYFLASGKLRFAVMMDIDRGDSTADWSTIDQQLHVGTNVWSQGFNYRIDNIRLIEVE